MSSEAVGWAFSHSPYRGAQFAVHLAIADSVNDQNDYEFWSTMGTLAAKSRTGRGTAASAVATLCADGFLEPYDITAPTTGQRVRYRFLFPDVDVVFRTKRYPPVTAQRAQPVTAQRAPSARSDDTLCAPTAQSTLLVPRTEEEPNSNALAIRDPFDEFWDVYPRKAGKGAARKAWTKALAKVGGVEVLLISAAARFAADPNREDRYTCHATTWLNQERWDDAPLPSRTAAPQMSRNQQNADAFFESIREREQRDGIGRGRSDHPADGRDLASGGGT